MTCLALRLPHLDPLPLALATGLVGVSASALAGLPGGVLRRFFSVACFTVGSIARGAAGISTREIRCGPTPSPRGAKLRRTRPTRVLSSERGEMHTLSAARSSPGS